MSKCEALVRHCKGCKRYFEKHEQMVHCPECGQERKCGFPPISGYNLCRRHGGPRPEVGYYSRKGKFSMTGRKALGTSPLNQTAAKYLEIKSDPQAQTLRPLHSVLNARLIVLMNRAGIGDSSSRMENIVQLWGRFKRHHPGLSQYYHGAEAKKAFNALDAEFEATVHDYAAWNEIYTLIDHKRKVSETEMKILKDMKALISAEDVTELVGKVLASVAKVVNDADKLEQIRYELAQLIGDPTAGGAGKREPTPVHARTSGVDSGQVLHTRDIAPSDSSGENHDDGLPEGHIEGSVLEG